jgi:hypothetical protein
MNPSQSRELCSTQSALLELIQQRFSSFRRHPNVSPRIRFEYLQAAIRRCHRHPSSEIYEPRRQWCSAGRLLFLAVGKLLFGRHEHSQAMHFASGMVGAEPLVVNEPPSLKNLNFDF